MFQFNLAKALSKTDESDKLLNVCAAIYIEYLLKIVTYEKIKKDDLVPQVADFLCKEFVLTGKNM